MYLKIKVVVDSKQEKIEKLQEDAYRIWVKQSRENNQANTRVLKIMRELFPETSVRIISGHHSPSKILSVSTITKSRFAELVTKSIPLS